MTQITFKIRKEWGSDELIDHSVVADIKNGWAVHKTVRSHVLWTVTHVKSGLCVGNMYETLADAMAMRERLIPITVNGVPLSELSTCEALTVSPIVARQLAEQKGEDPDEAAKWTQKTAADTARLMCPAT